MLETFNGGFVSARPATLLQPGECSLLQNAMYLPGQDHPRTMYGRSSLVAVASNRGVEGIAGCRFDDGTHRLLVLDDNNLLSSTNAESVGALASLSQLASGGSGLLALQSNNKWYLLNSGQRPRTFLQDGTIRAAGMLPVITTPALATLSGTWSDVATGYYQYWSTEIYRSTNAVEGGTGEDPFLLESTFIGKPGVVLVDSLSKGVQITLPDARNPNTTHLRVYRAGPMDYSTDSLFPIGQAHMSDVVYPFGGTNAVTDGAATPTSGYFATASANSTDLASFLTPYAYTAAGVTNILNATGANNTTVAAVPHPVYGAAPTCFGYKAFQAGSTLLTDTVVDPVAGVAVRLVVRGTHATKWSNYGVGLSFDGGTSWSGRRSVAIPPVGVGFASASAGGTTDTWALFPSKGGCSAANLIVGIAPLAIYPASELDSVEVIVYYNGSSGGDGTPFPAVVIEAAGLTAGGGMNGMPPTSTTGTIFEGSLVTNDVDNPAVVRYSQPGNVEYFPELYSISVGSNDDDNITHIGSVNNRLIIGLKGAIYRGNALPLQDDAQFIPQRTIELISDAHGIVSARAACNVTDANGRTALAFVSHNGVFLTDGNSVFPISDDLEWLGGANAVFTTGDSLYTDVVALINDPGSQTLRLLMKSGGSYFASYAQRHRKPGGMKWAGPNYTSNKAAGVEFQLHSAAVLRMNSGLSKVLYGYASGGVGSAVYAEDSPLTALTGGIPYDGASLIKVRTRRIYPLGLGGQARLTDAYILGRNNGADLGATESSPWSYVTGTTTYSNANPFSDYYLANAGGTNAELVKLPIGNMSGDSVQFTLTPYNSTDAVSYWGLQLEFENQGREGTRA